ncbi:hypothetical protein LOK49_LG07G01503 [Camellia lanceoleosa]|uniref:Uncharacterized protein n=1 Tax=Camellia lanceoleosa TaxID=1840588 RepID=A0ACC0H363_9ERIC|nr:hypothetical protein LOK49_LG07G01503 [Camellia lanceoleosa]
MESFELPEVTDECEDVSHWCLVGKILAPKILNKPAITKILLPAWKTRAGVSITPWKENIYLFQFEDLEDRSRVEAPSDGLLIHRSFLRLRIEVDVTKPLLQGLILYRRDSSGPVGDGIKVYYKYEKLTEFCYDCGRIGHDNLSCKFVSQEEWRNSGYGLNQRTRPVRSVTSLRSPNARPMGKLLADRDKSKQPLSIPIGAAAARSIRDDGVAASGSAVPSSQNLDENVDENMEVRSVRNRVVELGDTEFFQSEVPRPCTSSSPLKPSSLLDPTSYLVSINSVRAVA